MMKVFTLLLLSFIFSNFSIGQSPAQLDTTFSTDGKANLITPTQGLPQISPKHILQPDGKIIVCSNTDIGNFETQVMVARFNPNGIVDSSFGVNGRFDHSIVTGFNLAVGLQLQPDGKIVSAGIYNDFSGINNNEIFLLRLKPDGTLDSTFGVAGISRWNFSPDDERVSDLTIMPDGGFAITGYIISSVSSDSGFIMKTSANGGLDSSFATNGFLSFQHESSQTDLYAVSALPDNSIIVAGSFASQNNFQDLIIVKVDSNGIFYNSFGTLGIYTRDVFNDYDELHAMKIFPNGELLAAGYSYNGLNDGSVIIRLDSSGNEITGFGTGGVSYFPIPNTANRAYSIDVQQNGKIVLAGEFVDTVSFSSDFMVLRLLSNGSPDTSFNNSNAFVSTDFLNGDDRASSVLIQPDGRILVYGTGILDQINQTASPVLARYIGGDAIGPVSLELLSFTGIRSEDKNVLQWTTTGEINNDYFMVEKSSDAITFKDVAKISAQHHSSLIYRYSYTDPNFDLEGTYYRLRITDRDGKIDYSKIILLPGRNSDGFSVYPRIVTSDIFIQATGFIAQYYLYNNSGQKLKILKSGHNDLTNLPNGIYYIRGGNTVIRIMKQ